MKHTASDNLRALIVEDSDDDVVLLTNILKDGGFELDFEVVDTRDALSRHVRSGGWDVVFCDHSLPNLDAPNALEIVRKHDRNLPFFIVSGSMPDQLGSQQMHNGAADFFSKTDLSRLIPALKRELREARTRKELVRVTTALHHSKLFDAQTGLANAEFLRREMLQKIRRGKPFILAVVELSQLRPILKTTGLEWSKSFWSKIGKRISILHENELPARLSDDVFALLIDRDEGTREEDVAKSGSFEFRVGYAAWGLNRAKSSLPAMRKSTVRMVSNRV
jgi:PleD family two-component response regulator